MIYLYKNSSELIYARRKLIQTANIWLPGTKYAVYAGFLWYI